VLVINELSDQDCWTWWSPGVRHRLAVEATASWLAQTVVKAAAVRPHCRPRPRPAAQTDLPVATPLLSPRGLISRVSPPGSRVLKLAATDSTPMTRTKTGYSKRTVSNITACRDQPLSVTESHHAVAYVIGKGLSDGRFGQTKPIRPVVQTGRVYSKWVRSSGLVGRDGAIVTPAGFVTPCVGRDGGDTVQHRAPDDVTVDRRSVSRTGRSGRCARTAAAGVPRCVLVRRGGIGRTALAAAVLRAGGGRGDLVATGDPLERTCPTAWCRSLPVRGPGRRPAHPWADRVPANVPAVDVGGHLFARGGGGTAVRPLIVVVDDAQWLDEPSLAR